MRLEREFSDYASTKVYKEDYFDYKFDIISLIEWNRPFRMNSWEVPVSITIMVMRLYYVTSWMCARNGHI